jgi:hypothetical protein
MRVRNAPAARQPRPKPKPVSVAKPATGPQETMRRAYELLAGTQPFCEWDLPPVQEVSFGVLNANDTTRAGCYCKVNGYHTIWIAPRLFEDTSELISTMAHEMVHLAQRQRFGSGSPDHGAAFRQLALQVCDLHGFDAPRFFGGGVSVTQVQSQQYQERKLHDTWAKWKAWRDNVVSGGSS